MAPAVEKGKAGKLARKLARLDRLDLARSFKHLEKLLRKRAKKEEGLSATLYIVAHACHSAHDILQHPIRVKKK